MKTNTTTRTSKICKVVVKVAAGLTGIVLGLVAAQVYENYKK